MEKTERQFRDVIDLDTVGEHFGHFSALTGLSLRLTDPHGEVLLATDPEIAPGCALCALVQSRSSGRCQCMGAIARGGAEAHRWGGPFIFPCWLGMIEWTVPLLLDDQVIGLLVCGQVLLNGRDAQFRQAVAREGGRLGLAGAEIEKAIERVPIINPQQCRAASELLQLMANQLNEQGAQERQSRRRQVEQQQRIAEAIHGLKAGGAPRASYPMDLEKQLINAVRLGEISRAKEMLNALLGAIFFRDMGQTQVLKARLVELLAMLSRAAVEAGGQLEEVLGANLAYLREILHSQTAEAMGGIVIQALDRFTEGVYATRNTEQLRVLGEALAYVRQHAGEDLSLEDVARACHKNSSTLRKLFREQLGTTFSDTINKLRVERAIGLLRDPHRSLAGIAVEVGFYDQSHFGKIFRQITGYTPALYRKKIL